MRARILGFAVLLLALSVSVHAASPCELLLIQRAMLTQSVTLQETLFQQTTPAEYDFVIVGGGAASAAFVVNLRTTNPKARVLVVEKGRALSQIFGRHKDFYRMTTRSLPEDEQNAIPGARLQPYDFRDPVDSEHDPNPLPGEMGMAIASAHKESGADYLFESNFSHVEIQGPGHGYSIELNSGVRVKAAKIVYATGLGESRLRFFDDQTQQLLVKQLDAPNSRIQSFDCAIERALLDRDNHIPALLRYAGKRVVVIGRGVASSKFMDFLLGLAPQTIYGGFDNSTLLPRQVYWAGGEPTRPKSSPVQLSGAKTTVRHIEATPGTSLKIWIENRNTSEQVLEADEVIIAPGAENTWLSELTSLTGQRSARLVAVFDPATGQVIGKRVIFDGQYPQDIFVTGAAAGNDQLFADEIADSEVKTPVGLFHMLPRASRLAMALGIEKAPDDGEYKTTDTLKARVVEWWFKGKQSVSEQEIPEIFFLAGIPGSGKSTWVENARHAGRFNEANTILVDPDLIREVLPGYLDQMKKNPKQAAQWVHSIATQLQIPIVQRALRTRMNLVIDGTFRDRPFFEKLFQQIRSEFPDYAIRIIHLVVDPAHAAKQVHNRFLLTGRYVPPQDLGAMSNLIDENVRVLGSLANSVEEVRLE